MVLPGKGSVEQEQNTDTLVFPLLPRARNHETKSGYMKQWHAVSLSHCLCSELY